VYEPADRPYGIVGFQVVIPKKEKSPGEAGIRVTPVPPAAGDSSQARNDNLGARVRPYERMVWSSM